MTEFFKSSGTGGAGRRDGGALRAAVHGARGRMGARVCALARREPRIELVAELDVDSPTPDSSPAIDAVIDFSSDSGAAAAVQLALQHHAALLVGTTGLSPATMRALDQAAKEIPVLIAPNTAVGVAALNAIGVHAARLLGPSFAIDIVETHHTAKKDAPSGTALRLAQALQEQARRDLPPGQIRSIRQGEVIGEHVIHFNGPGERLTITHQALDRDLFAAGALRAVLWLRNQPPGRYSIEQALGMGP